MLRDASHRQAIQKFSFIESLNLSHLSQNSLPSGLGRVNTDRAFCFQQRQKYLSGKSLSGKLSAPVKSGSAASSAIVSNSDVTATIDRHWYETPDYSLSLAEIIQAGSESSYLDSDTDSRSAVTAKRIGKIVFALACGYGLFVGYWLFGDRGGQLLNSLAGGKQVVLSRSEVEFLDYMEQSLTQIERDRTDREQNEGEVVYIPVYTPSPTANHSAPPAFTPSPTAGNIPQAAPPAPLSIPAPPPLPSPAPIANNAPPVEAIASKPQINHTLIGVLELGADRSAALVKVNGKTRRIWLGEKIHADGWILQSVGNQVATIEHQGQVRSISVGETF